MKIGITLESTGYSLRHALPEAARMGAKGVQFDAFGDLAPDRLTDTGKREIRNLLRTYALELSALHCPLRRGIDNAEHLQPRLDYIRQVMTLAFELGPCPVIIPCPRLPNTDETVRANLLRESLSSLGAHGDRIGTNIALEIGFDPAEKVRDFLNSFALGALGVNFDPANYIMHGYDALKQIVPLAGKLWHVTARDARGGTVSRSAQEVPLGAGDIDWLTFTASLSAIEYRDWLTIKRTNSAQPLDDLRAAIPFLRRVIVL